MNTRLVGEILSVSTPSGEDFRRGHTALETRPEAISDSIPALLTPEAPRRDLCHYGNGEHDLRILRLFTTQESEKLVDESLRRSNPPQAR